MSEALREAVSSASAELGGSTEKTSEKQASVSSSQSSDTGKSRDTRDTSSKTETVENAGKWSAPKWTQQWKKDTQGALSKLAELDQEAAYLPAVLKEVEDRYDYSGKLQKDFENYRKRFDPYGDILGNLEQRFGMQGVHPTAGLQQMVQVSDFLQRDPDQAIAWLASQFRPRDAKSLLQNLGKAFGVDFSGLAEQQPWVDPAVKEMLNNTLTPLQQQNQQLMGMLQNMYSGQFQQAQYAVANHLKAFVEATDDTGSPKYPHFQRLEPIMAAIIRNSGPIYDIRQVNLDQLYEQAAWNDPEIREKMITDRARKAEADAIKAAQEQNAEAEKAQRASRNVNGSTRAAPKKTGGNLRDIMKEETRRLANR